MNVPELLGRSGVEAFRYAMGWAADRKIEVLDNIVDGADPEYAELMVAFDKGVELGVKNLLGLVEDGNDLRVLANISFDPAQILIRPDSAARTEMQSSLRARAPDSESRA